MYEMQAKAGRPLSRVLITGFERYANRLKDLDAQYGTQTAIQVAGARCLFGYTKRLYLPSDSVVRSRRKLAPVRPLSLPHRLATITDGVAAVALVFQPGTLAFRPLQVPPQPIDSSFKLTDGVGAIRHIEVMPDSGTLYKSRMFGMEGQTR